MSRPQLRGSAGWLCGVCFTVNAVLGWRAGYRSPTSYIVFWFLAALAVAAARRVVRSKWRSADPVANVIRIAVVALAVVVGCGLVLGALAQLTQIGFAVAELLVCVGVYLTLGPPVDDVGNQTEATDRVPAAVAGIVGALSAFVLVYSATHAPGTLYDSLSYHLFFPARWVQEHAVSIVPTPFSDVAQAYAPADGELFFAWLMLPFHGDLLARIGQLPFASLGAVTLYAIAVRLGAPAAGVFYPSAFLLLSRPVVEQAIGADVDLICASLFLAALYFAIVAVDSNERRDWIVFGVAAGLFAGTKYLAVVYVPILVLAALARGLRSRALWALPGLAAFGAPWYLRNWIVAGSPIYPASLTMAGFTLARGAFDRAAMLNTVFHSTSARLVPFVVAHAMGTALFLLWLPCVVVGAVVMIRRGWRERLLLAVPVLVAALCWFVIPVNTDSRFLLPALAPALLPIAFLFDDGGRSWNRIAHVLMTAGMVWIVVGDRVQLPAADLPWFMEGWLSLDGIVPPTHLVTFAMVAVAIAVAWRLRPGGARWFAAAAISLVAAAAGVVAVGSLAGCAESPCEYLRTTSPRIRPALLESWRWIDEHATESTVAYTGINLPYPLTGRRLTNRVVYANIDGRLRWRFHDYQRAFRSGRFRPAPPLLATSSGELMPATRAASGEVDALRPRYERMEGVREAWEFNLTRLHARWLFISALSAYERDYVWHDDGDLPIEHAWAEADPAMFHLEYQSAGVRIYSIATGRAA